VRGQRDKVSMKAFTINGLTMWFHHEGTIKDHHEEACHEVVILRGSP